MSIEITLRKTINFLIITSIFILLYLWSLNSKDVFIISILVSLFFYIIMNISKREHLIFSFVFLFIISMAVGKNFIPYYVIFMSPILTLLLKKNIKVVVFSKLFLSFLFILMVIFFSNFYAVNKEMAFEGLITYLIIFLIIYCISMISYNYKFDTSLLMHQFLLANLFLLFIFFTNNSLTEINSTHRALIYFTENSGIRSNTLAGIVAIFIPIVIGYIFKEKVFIIGKLTGCLCVLLNFITLVLLQSRGAYIGLLFALILLFAYQRLTKKVASIFFVSMFGFFIAVIFPEIINEIFGRFINVSNEDITNGRIPLYEASYKMFMENPVFGSGLNQLGPHMGAYEVVDAHNFLLTYISSIGILGLILFLVYLSLILKVVVVNLPVFKKKIYPIPFLGIAVFVQVIHGMFEPTMTTSLPLMLFAIISTLFYWETNSQSTEDKSYTKYSVLNK